MVCFLIDNRDTLFLRHLIYWALLTRTYFPRGEDSGLGTQFPPLRTTQQRTTAVTSVMMADVTVRGGVLSSVTPVQPRVLPGCFPRRDPVCGLPSLLHLISHPDVEERGPFQERSGVPRMRIS